MNPKLICLFVVIAAVCADVKVPAPELEPKPESESVERSPRSILSASISVPSYIPSVRYVNPVPYYSYAPYSSLYYPSVRAIAPAHISHVASLSHDTPLDPHHPVLPFARYYVY